MPVAQTFSFVDEENIIDLSQFSYIDPMGVWWASMPFDQRLMYPSFIDNREFIESNWTKSFGDRKIELVFIGKHMNEEKIRTELTKCLSTPEELSTKNWKKGYADKWPIQNEVFQHQNRWQRPEFIYTNNLSKKLRFQVAD